MAKTDRWIALAAFVGLAGLIVFDWVCDIPGSKIANTVLGLTALILLWYTVEMARLRRDAEARTLREREPLVYFEVVQTDKALPGIVKSSGIQAVLKAGQEYTLRFNFINHSANSAMARVFVRLKIEGQVATSKNPAYDGTQVWEITPFFRISGWFHLFDLIATTQRALGAGAWPTEPMTLGAQVDLYRSDRTLVNTTSKEYTIQFDLQECAVRFWPEICASAVPQVSPPTVLPTRTVRPAEIDASV